MEKLENSRDINIFVFSLWWLPVWTTGKRRSTPCPVWPRGRRRWPPCPAWPPPTQPQPPCPVWRVWGTTRGPGQPRNFQERNFQPGSLRVSLTSTRHCQYSHIGLKNILELFYKNIFIKDHLYNTKKYFILDIAKKSKIKGDNKGP